MTDSTDPHRTAVSDAPETLPRSHPRSRRILLSLDEAATLISGGHGAVRLGGGS